MHVKKFSLSEPLSETTAYNPLELRLLHAHNKSMFNTFCIMNTVRKLINQLIFGLSQEISVLQSMEQTCG